MQGPRRPPPAPIPAGFFAPKYSCQTAALIRSLISATSFYNPMILIMLIDSFKLSSFRTRKGAVKPEARYKPSIAYTCHAPLNLRSLRTPHHCPYVCAFTTMNEDHNTMDIKSPYAATEGMHNGLSMAESKGDQDEDDMAQFGKRPQLKVCLAVVEACGAEIP